MPRLDLDRRDDPRRYTLAGYHQTQLQQAIHEPHAEVRDKIVNALAASSGRWYERNAARMATCCQGASFFFDRAAEAVRPWLSRCKHRLCPYCGKARTAHVAVQLHGLMQQMERPRILILTVKHTDDPLSLQIAALRKWFAALRRRKFWRDHVAGGAYTLEIKRNHETHEWHPHLHIVFDGDFLPQKLLRKLWHDITTASDIIWLQEVHDIPGAAIEMAKYIGKPTNMEHWTVPEITEYARAVAGARMVHAFGRFHGAVVKDEDPQQDVPEAAARIKLSELVWHASRGHLTPQRLLPKIAERWRQFRSYIFHAMPQLEPPKTQADKLRIMQAIVNGHTPPTAHAPPKDETESLLDVQISALFALYVKERALDVYTYDPEPAENVFA